MSWHMATMWEAVAQCVPDHPAIIFEERSYSWREYDDRAARVAQVLLDHGLKAGSKLSIYSHNSAQYLESQYGAFKAQICPVNINYRYLEKELIHVINNSDSEAVIYQARFADNVHAIRDQLEQVKLFLEIDDGSGKHMDGAVDYESALQAASPMPAIERSGDDLYMLYTGGTTGMPKGVMYSHDLFVPGLIAAGFVMRGFEPPANIDELVAAIQNIHSTDGAPRSITACPLMHGTGMWIGAMLTHFLGGTNILFDNRHFDAHALWQLAQDHRATDLAIVGDVFAKPMVAALNEAHDKGQPYDVSAMNNIGSSGVMWSAEVKRGLLEHMDARMIDSMGSSEGSMGTSITTRENLDGNQTAEFEMNPTTKVFTEDEREVQPGSDEIGLICNGGMVPLGYYKDAKKSAATFREINGHKYSIPGDFAKVAADGSIILLGRGSVCINSGGEKIFPEEVEEVLKTHDQIYDTLVVGVPDDRFGEKIVAVVSTADSAPLDIDSVTGHVKGELAGYKAPRQFITVDTVPRAANGKPDYKSAKDIALESLGLAAS